MCAVRDAGSRDEIRPSAPVLLAQGRGAVRPDSVRPALDLRRAVLASIWRESDLLQPSAMPLNSEDKRESIEDVVTFRNGEGFLEHDGEDEQDPSGAVRRVGSVDQRAVGEWYGQMQGSATARLHGRRSRRFSPMLTTIKTQGETSSDESGHEEIRTTFASHLI